MTEQEIDREIWSSVKKAALEQCDFFRHGGEVLIPSEAITIIDGKQVLDDDAPKILVTPDKEMISQMQKVLSIGLENIDSVEKVRQLLSVKCHYIISGSVRKAKGSEVIKLLYKGDGFTFVGQFINSAKPYDFELSKTLENRLKELRELADLPQLEAKEPPQKTKQVKTLEELPNSEANKQETPKLQPSQPEPEKINWQGSKSQLIFLIDQLYDNGLLKNFIQPNKDVLLDSHFTIKGQPVTNAASLREQYKNNKTGKPRGSEIIEEIISKTKEHGKSGNA